MASKEQRVSSLQVDIGNAFVNKDVLHQAKKSLSNNDELEANISEFLKLYEADNIDKSDEKSDATSPLTPLDVNTWVFNYSPQMKIANDNNDKNEMNDEKKELEKVFNSDESNLLLCGNKLCGKTTILTRFRMLCDETPCYNMNTSIEYQSAMMYSVIECINCMRQCSFELRDRYYENMSHMTGNSGKNNDGNNTPQSPRTPQKILFAQTPRFAMSNEEIQQIKKYEKLKQGLTKENQENWKQLKNDIGKSIESWKKMVLDICKDSNNNDLNKLTKKEKKTLNDKLKDYCTKIGSILNDKIMKFTITKLYTCQSYHYHNVIYWLYDKRENYQRLFKSIDFIPNEADYLYCHYIQDNDAIEHSMTISKHTQLKMDLNQKLNLIDMNLYDTNYDFWTKENINSEIPIMNIDTLIFVVSLSSYTENAINDKKFNNRLTESLKLFENILKYIGKEKDNDSGECSIDNLRDVTLILTLCDEFKYMLEIIPFESRIKDFESKGDPLSVLKYVITQFEKIYVNQFVLTKIQRTKEKKEKNGNSESKTEEVIRRLDYHLVSGWSCDGVQRIWKGLKQTAFANKKEKGFLD